jgi:CheY-like chemotaxis protein
MTIPSVLIVDDSNVARLTLQEYLKPAGYSLDLAADGAEAWELLNKNPEKYMAILLDRVMPKMDGMELLKEIKNHDRLKRVPVIMQTAKTLKCEIEEGIVAGAYYYLTKPYTSDNVKLITAAAVENFLSFESPSGGADGRPAERRPVETNKYIFSTLEDVRTLSKILSQQCPDPVKAAAGLWELLLNAVEHGNLGISYKEKSNLLEEDLWEKEVNRRLTLPEYASKTGAAYISRKADEIHFRITDQGKGFDWEPYLEISPERAFDAHGRGIAMSKSMSFDKLEYYGRGNEVLAVVSTA